MNWSIIPTSLIYSGPLYTITGNRLLMTSDLMAYDHRQEIANKCKEEKPELILEESSSVLWQIIRLRKR